MKEEISELAREIYFIGQKRGISHHLFFPEATMDDVAFANHPCYATNLDDEIIGVNLSNLWLPEIPNVITQLTHLHTIRLFGNNLADVPTSIAKLLNLTRLYLPHNQFVEIPPVLTELKSLEVLAINQNALKILPPSIANLTNLQKLGLSGNNLTTLPATMGALTTLRSLFLANNRLSELPDWVTHFVQLEELSLSRNSIGDLPPSFDQLSNLRLLSLRETKFTSVPSAIFALSKLEELDLGGTPIDHLPIEISKLIHLKILSLNATQIHSLPADLLELQELCSLNLSSLRLAEIPSEIFRLRNLSELNLSSTKTRSISAEIGRLSRLENLNLSGMGLTSVPTVLLGLKKLSRLNLVGNRIRELPPQITQSTLDVYWRVPNGQKEPGIFLHGNPLESPPPEIIKKGRRAIYTYFKSLKGDRKPIDEVKVLIVGDGGAGKTSLVKRLTGREYDENEPQTHGINIEDFTVLTGSKRIKAHFWDFGGQEIMHATHQFFLSKRSAYILVLDGRKDEKTEYWLKHIEAFGGNSPVLIVMNKIDQYPSFDVNRRFLAEKYPGVKDFLKVSCSIGFGVDLLLKALSSALARVEHTKTMWAARWFNVKERIELMTDDFISYSRFRDICIEEQIEDYAEQETLVEFLHDLGVALRFNELPLRDTNVINPRWLTAGVYQIVNSEEVATAGGVLRLDLLHRILDHKVHPPEKHHFLIELMKKFELCYEIDRNSVLLPALLPVEEPKVNLENEDVSRFFIDYDFFPKSIMPRFIVRMHHDIDQNLRWRTGAVLRNSKFDTQAVVRADEVDRRIEIDVYGTQRRDYLGVILHAFRSINESFEKLKYIEKVPMPDRADVTISYAHLIRLASKGVRTYMPDGTEKEYDVQELLGWIKPEGRSEEEIIEILRELRDKNDTEASLLAKANKSFLLQPNFFGLGVNLNELIKLIIKGRGKDEVSN